MNETIKFDKETPSISDVKNVSSMLGVDKVTGNVGNVNVDDLVEWTAEASVSITKEYRDQAEASALKAKESELISISSASEAETSAIKAKEEADRAEVAANYLGKYGNTCKNQDNIGEYIIPKNVTIATGTPIININRYNKKWGSKSYEVTLSDSAGGVYIDLGKTISEIDNISVWVYIPSKYNMGNISGLSIATYNNTTLIGKEKIDFIEHNKLGFDWFLFKLSSVDLNNPKNFNRLRVRISLNSGAVKIDGSMVKLFIDSVVINQKLRPTLAIGYDDLWQGLLDNGVYQWHLDNNIPLNITSSEVNSYNGNTDYKIFAQKLVKSGLACVCCYSLAMQNDVTYPSFINKMEYFEDRLLEANNGGQEVILTATCANNNTTQQMYNAFDYLGIGMVRGSGRTAINYLEQGKPTLFGVRGFYGMNTNTQEQVQQKITDAKAYIDTLINGGQFGAILTHDVLPLPSIIQPNLYTQIEVWFAILNYAKQKQDSGELDIVRIDYFSKNSKL